MTTEDDLKDMVEELEKELDELKEKYISLEIEIENLKKKRVKINNKEGT